MKKNYELLCFEFRRWKNLIRAMKLTISLLLFSVLSVMAGSTYSQSARFDLKMKNVTLVDVFTEIERNSDFGFFFKNEEIIPNAMVSVDVEGASIDEVLDRILEDNYDYRILNNNIIITRLSTSSLNQVKREITGMVSDSDGGPLPGVTVFVKGTTQGTITDFDGKYSLENVTGESVIVFSFVGMKTQEIIVGNKTSLDVILVEDAIGLEEVVAIGYGVQKKKLVTGATAQVKGEKIEQMKTTNVLGALQSTAPGISITKTSGEPGEGFKINIRGIGTIGNAAPLYVVNGVTVDNIDNISPSDIESVDVLKDAASAAIYGARAANGVILVTTKQGKAGKPQITYDGYYGWQGAAKKMDFLNAKEYMEIMDEQVVNVGGQPYDWANLFPGYYEDIMSGKTEGTDWYDQLVKGNAPIQNHAFNIAGGTDQSVYSIGLSYNKQEGYIGGPIDPSYERYNVRINTEHTLIKNKNFKVLTIGENLSLSRSTRKQYLVIDGQWNSLRSAMTMNPIYPVKDDSGDYITGEFPYETFLNTLASIEWLNKDKRNISNKLVSNMYMNLQPIKNLTIRSSFGIDGVASTLRRYIPVHYLADQHFETQNQVQQQMSTGYKWIFENSINYIFNIKDHNFDVLVGTSAEKSGMGMNLRVNNKGSIFDDFEHAYIDNANVVDVSNTVIGGSPFIQNRLSSYFGRVNYDLKETYMASVVMRADGSSNFAKGNRWGYFPSVSAGWVMTNESFLKNTSSWLDFLKVRASWGQNGNQNVPAFQYLSTIAYDAPYMIGTDELTYKLGAYPDIFPNKDITWETSEQLDLGFDARLFGGRLNVNFDYYDKTTKDWLIQAPIAYALGTGAPYINGGDISNKGVELAASWREKIHDFTYNISANVSKNKNRVIKIANSEGIIHGPANVVSNSSAEMYRAQVGYPIGYFWGYKTDGLFQNTDDVQNYRSSDGVVIQPDAAPGDIRFVDVDDNGIINDDDKVMIGDPNPDYTFNFGFDCQYKGFDFAIVANGVVGSHIFRMYRSYAVVFTHNYLKDDVWGRWTGEGTSNSIPRVTPAKKNDQYISDRFVENGDYLRINNLTVGYDFKKVMPNIPLSKARLYATVQNLHTFTKYRGFDPEVGSGDNWAGGIDLGIYPSPRTIMIGVSLSY